MAKEHAKHDAEEKVKEHLPMRLRDADHLPDVQKSITDKEENDKKTARRSLAIASKVRELDIPQSMKHHAVIQFLSDEEIDAMASDWKEGKVVRSRGAQWGEEKAKEK